MTVSDFIPVKPAQLELVAAFERGEVQGASPPVVRVNTNLSHVFLSGEFAYKLKRAVLLPFVNFQSVESRKIACEAEVSINRSLGSPLYIGAHAVTRGADGCWRIGGEGEAEDWVVITRRFAQSDQFDMMASAGRLTTRLVERAARRIAKMHSAAAVNLMAGHVADYRQIIRRLQLTEVEAASGFDLTEGDPSLFLDLDRELSRVGPLIERRRAAGKVRRGHGDLHLRNICLFEGEPTPFDALEFDTRMATTDVLYDVAFFLMDLRRFNLLRQANAAMNAYWDESGEEEDALGLLPFFMALRATIRMATAIIAADFEEAAHYRTLAREFLCPQPSALIAIGGLSGCGKTSVAKELAPCLPGPAGGRVIRTDVLRKQACERRGADHAGEAMYTPQARAEVYRRLEAKAKGAITAGAWVIADATFAEPEARKGIESAASDCWGYWLAAPLATRLKRIESRMKDASDADSRVAVLQREPSDIGRNWLPLDASIPVWSTVAAILDDLRSRETKLHPKLAFDIA